MGAPNCRGPLVFELALPNVRYATVWSCEKTELFIALDLSQRPRFHVSISIPGVSCTI